MSVERIPCWIVLSREPNGALQVQAFLSESDATRAAHGMHGQARYQGRTLQTTTTQVDLVVS